MKDVKVLTIELSEDEIDLIVQLLETKYETSDEDDEMTMCEELLKKFQ